MATPYVGILVNDALFASIPQGIATYEAIDFYLQAGKELGFQPCFFRMKDVCIKTLTVRAFVPAETGFIKEKISLPEVIHNRAIYPHHETYFELESWANRGIKLFNRWNRYSKLYIHKILMKDQTLRPHLPLTYAATSENVIKMMKNSKSLIIKPNRSSIGRGVMHLERLSGRWTLTYPENLKISNRIWNKLKFRTQLPSLLLRRIRRLSYIVQERIPLATFEGRPFDMRVSVQRGANGYWGITGIVVKVAAPNLFLTNVAQGGEVKQFFEVLKQLPHLNPEIVYEHIIDLSLRVAYQLSKELPHLADLGLDIAITEDGYPMFIECNSKDQRYSFKEADMKEEWEATYKNPMAYANYLLQGGKPR